MPYHSAEGGLKEGRRSWASLYAWQLTRNSDAPLFRQIYAQLRAAILAQDLRPGTKLPSTRQLASQLRVVPGKEGGTRLRPRGPTRRHQRQHVDPSAG